jgi:hypothetical protein
VLEDLGNLAVLRPITHGHERREDEEAGDGQQDQKETEEPPEEHEKPPGMSLFYTRETVIPFFFESGFLHNGINQARDGRCV